MQTIDGRNMFTILVFGIAVAVLPTYYKWREVGRREFMRREDRKVENAIASMRAEEEEK